MAIAEFEVDTTPTFPIAVDTETPRRSNRFHDSFHGSECGDIRGGAFTDQPRSRGRSGAQVSQLAGQTTQGPTERRYLEIEQHKRGITLDCKIGLFRAGIRLGVSPGIS
jgi:hypothetical protein